jgi:hypothetical protein
MTPDAPQTRSRFRRALIGTLAILAMLLVGGVVLTWAWNTLAVDLAQAPRIQFRHALAFEAGLAAVAWLIGASLRRALGSTASPAHRAQG